MSTSKVKAYFEYLKDHPTKGVGIRNTILKDVSGRNKLIQHAAENGFVFNEVDLFQAWQQNKGWISQTCNKCSGQGYLLIRCPVCEGALPICARCSGTGKVWVDCDPCNTTGWLWIWDPNPVPKAESLI